ncbi:MAG: alpha/beta hydrolase [Jatrophihabitans sp.]|uniref:alpha/beta hydrolase n=1 Tax=Jatrophihabitans sp. TaxID=1932789 RepID=UPI003F7EA4FB
MFAAAWRAAASVLVIACALTACSAAGAHSTTSTGSRVPAPSTDVPPTRPVASSTSSSARPSRPASPSSSPTATIAALPKPGTGSIVERTIAGTADGYQPRPALIYLPPAAAHRRLPVLELLHGTPGSPSDWLDKGDLGVIAGAFARAHHGAAPIIVLPDINGARRADTECIRTTSGGDVERYLAHTVPAWITAHLPAETGAAHWAVGGMSEGGTCALMLGLRHPDVFGTMIDLSGLAHLTLGNTDDRARTTADLFAGSSTAYDEHDPPWLLAHARFPSTGVWLECGASDRQIVAAQRLLAVAARGAGAAVRASTVSGRHTWTVWDEALTSALPWSWQRIEGS